MVNIKNIVQKTGRQTLPDIICEQKPDLHKQDTKKHDDNSQQDMETMGV